MRVTLVRIPRMIPMISTRLMFISRMTPIAPTIPASGEDAPGSGEQSDDG
jgi:hypothetical protein